MQDALGKQQFRRTFAETMHCVKTFQAYQMKSIYFGPLVDTSPFNVHLFARNGLMLFYLLQRSLLTCFNMVLQLKSLYGKLY